MNSERWIEVKTLFGEALALDGDARRAYLDEACADDEIRAEVEGLLASYEGAPSFFGELADDLLGPAWIPDDGQPAVPLADPHGLIGQQVSHYHVLSKHGGGGMGVIYRARDTRLDRIVALKFLPPHLMMDEAAQARFTQEARAASALDHPNIGTIYDIGRSDDGRLFIAMAFYEGETLKEKIARGPLPVALAFDYATQIARGLAAAHAAGIVHRDVKPANVIVTVQGAAKLLDFGLAKTEDVELTKPGALMGTAAYMSPEQARGDAVDARTDLWALGILLYEMLAGRRPFQSVHEQAVVYAVLYEPPDPLPTLRPEVPPALAACVHRLLEKDPAQRYPDAAALLADLEARHDGEAAPPPAVPPPPPFLQAEETPELAQDDASVFVGRHHELGRLEAALTRMLAGQGGVLMVTGEAGTGKTALLREFTRRALAAHPGLVAAWGHCNAHTGLGDPYLPFREVLSLLTGDVEARYAAGTLSRERARRLWAVLPQTAQALVEVAPDLVDVFVPGAALMARASVYASVRPAWMAALEHLVQRRAAQPPDPNLQQQDLFEQYTRLLQAGARAYPLVIVLEDLHWTDAGSASLLFHLARRLDGQPLLVIGSYRPADVVLGFGGERHPLEPVLNEFRRDFGDFEIEVGQEDGQNFVDALLDVEPNHFGAGFRQALYRQTRGHSLFTVELLRSLKERGLIVRDDDGYWREGPTMNWELLPARVEGAIGERIDRLPAALQEVLQAASVEGEEFTAQVVARVRRHDERELVRLLSNDLDRRHRLVRAQDLRQVGRQRVTVYRFRHILFQRYLYGRLDTVERAYLHEDVGHGLEDLYAGQTELVAARLARHFEEAGRLDKAVAYLSQAGEAAVRLAAMQEALAHFNRGLDLVERLPETPERLRAELGLEFGRALAIQASHSLGAPALADAYARTRELSRRLGDPEQLVRALFFSTQFHAMRADYRQALGLAEQIIALGEQAGHLLLRRIGRGIRGFVSLFLGDFDTSHADHEFYLADYDAQKQDDLVAYYGFVPGVNMHTWIGWTLWLRGFPDQGLRHAEGAIAMARRLEHPLTLTFALMVAGCMFLRRRGETDALEERAREAARLAAEKGFGHYQALSMVYQGWALTERGQVEEGIEQMRAAWVGIQAVGARLNTSEYEAMLAEAYLRAGNAAEGLAAAERGLAFADDTGERFYEAELHRLRGELRRAAGAAEADVVACFEQALAVAGHQGARAWTLRAATSLARFRQDDETRRRLAAVYDTFTEGFDTADLRAARAVLEDADGAAR